MIKICYNNKLKSYLKLSTIVYDKRIVDNCYNTIKIILLLYMINDLQWKAVW